MAADMTGEQMQAKITAARREAEGLKDKIRRRKDELADTSRTHIPLILRDRPPGFNSEIPLAPRWTNLRRGAGGEYISMDGMNC